MSGHVPLFIIEGGKVLYNGQVRVIRRYYFTCPCAIGEAVHHPEDDVLMLVFAGGEKVPYSFKTIKSYRGK